MDANGHGDDTATQKKLPLAAVYHPTGFLGSTTDTYYRGQMLSISAGSVQTGGEL
jgi:hypothetical protein